jgi:hypothetical protein
MRAVIAANGMVTMANNEEFAMLTKFKDRKLYRKDLTERETEVTRLMVNRGLINRRSSPEGMFFVQHAKWRMG